MSNRESTKGAGSPAQGEAMSERIAGMTAVQLDTAVEMMVETGVIKSNIPDRPWEAEDEKFRDVAWERHLDMEVRSARGLLMAVIHPHSIPPGAEVSVTLPGGYQVKVKSGFGR